MDIAVLLADNIKGAVNMLKRKIRSFQKLYGFFKSIEFGRREKDSPIKKPGKDTVEVVCKPVSGSNIGTDLVESQLVIELLQKKVTAIEKALFICGETF